MELEDELQNLGTVSREAYQGIERKVLNRMKMMSNEGLVNLVETNERMFAGNGYDNAPTGTNSGFVAPEATMAGGTNATAAIKKVSGW
jgi:hypothetical protein